MKRKTPAKASLRKAARRGWTTRAVEAALEFTQERSSELKGFLAFSAAVVLLLSLIPKDPNLLGVAGRLLFRMSFGALGLTAYLLPFGLGAWGLARLFKLQVMAPTVKLAGGLLALRNSGRAGMPGEEVLRRASKRAREQAAGEDAEDRGPPK